MREVKQIWKPLKEIDAEIRTAVLRQDEDKKVYWDIEVGLYESLGERGLIYTLFYDDFPTEEEIKKDVIEKLKEEKEEYENKLLTHIEEEYLRILEKINKKDFHTIPLIKDNKPSNTTALRKQGEE